MLRDPVRRARWALVVASVAALLLSVVGPVAPVTSAGAASAPGARPAQLVTLTLGAGGSLRVVGATSDTSIDLPRTQPAARAERSVRRAQLSRPDAEAVTVEVLDRAGQVTYRRTATVERTLRAELPTPGSDVLTGRVAPTPQRTLTLALPVDGAAVRVTSARTGTTTAAVPLVAARAGARAGEPSVVPLTGYPAGDPANRLDVVILGDGYTAAQADDFAADAQRVADGLLTITPYSDYRPFLNVVGVFAPSAQSGADHPAYSAGCAASSTHPISCCPDVAAPAMGGYADTRYDSSYCYDGIERLMVPIDQPLAKADASAAYPQWDQLIMVVNDPTYGGSGGPVATTSLAPEGVEILKHELGHSLLGLDDEYADLTPGYPPCSDTGRLGLTDPCAANVTDATTLGQLKWSRWVAPGTPIPTSSPQLSSVVGLFLGAHYSPTTWYRSCDECLMRFLDRPFGAVAAEQLPVRLYSGGWQGPASSLDDRIELVEPGSALPATPAVDLPAGEEQTFSVRLLGPVGLGTRVEWSVDGAPVATETVGPGATSAYTLTGDADEHVVQVRATDVAGILHPSLVDESASTHEWEVGEPSVEPQQLLVNGGFESALSPGWRLTRVAPSARRCTGPVSEGACAVTLTAARSSRSLTTQVGPVEAAAGDQLVLRVAADPADLRARGTVTASVVLADGTRHQLVLGPFPRDARDRTAYVSSQAPLTLTAAVSSATVRVSLGRGSGRLRVDDVGLWLTPAG